MHNGRNQFWKNSDRICSVLFVVRDLYRLWNGRVGQKRYFANKSKRPKKQSTIPCYIFLPVMSFYVFHKSLIFNSSTSDLSVSYWTINSLIFQPPLLIFRHSPCRCSAGHLPVCNLSIHTTSNPLTNTPLLPSTADSHILKRRRLFGPVPEGGRREKEQDLAGVQRENGAEFSRPLVFAKPTSQMHRKRQRLLRKECISSQRTAGWLRTAWASV